MLSGIGVLLTVLRAFEIGDQPIIGLLPLSMLLFVGPLAELTVGLLVGRVERRAAWSPAGLPARLRAVHLDHHARLPRRHARSAVLLGQDHPLGLDLDRRRGGAGR